MWLYLQSTLRAGVRGRSIQAILILGGLLMGVAYLAASFSPRQPQTVALDVGFSAIRAVLVLLGLFWIQELVMREIDRKTVILAVSYPIPRSRYLIGRYLGIIALQGLAAVLLALLLWLVTLFAGKGYAQLYPVHIGLPFFAGIFGIWLDVCVVSAFALLVASFATVSILPLALGACFAIGGKSVGAARAYLMAGADGDTALVQQMAPWLETIHWILPDLSRLDWRSWSMYGFPPGTEQTLWAVLAALSYISALTSMACGVFARRQFS